MAFIHTTWPELCSKGVGSLLMLLTAAYSLGQAAFPTLPAIPGRYIKPQVCDTTNNTTYINQQGTTWPERVHGRRLGRSSRYTKEHNRFRDPILGYNSALWIRYTSSRSTLISREWVLRHRYRNFLREILTNNLKIHTDSSSGKSMATRIGVSKRAKHIKLKYVFIWHLIQDGILAIHKINTKHNPADILTKYLTREVLQWHLYQAGIRPPESWGEIQLQQFHHGSWGEIQLQSFHRIAEELHSYRSLTYQHTNTHVWAHACSMRSLTYTRFTTSRRTCSFFTFVIFTSSSESRRLNEYMGTTWYSLRFAWSTTSHGYMFTKFEMYKMLPWICTTLFGCMDTVWISLAVPSVLAVQAPASGTGLNSLSTHGSALELRWGTALLVVVGPHRQRRDGTVSQGGTGTCVPTYMGRDREPCRGTGCEVHVCGNDSAGVQCPVDRRWHFAGCPTYSPQHRIYILALQLSRCGDIHAVVHRDRSRGIHARLLHGDVCSQCTQGSHQFVPWLGQSFQQKLSRPDVPGWTCVHVRYYGAWIADSAQDPRQLDANSQALQLYQWAHLDSARASECAYSDQQASHWPSTCGPFYEPVPLRYSSCSTYGRWFTEGAATLHSSIHCTGERALQWGRELGISTDEGQSGSHEYGHLSHIGCHGHYGWWDYSWRSLKYKNWDLRGIRISEALLIHDVDTCE